jgi:hypothetical protein
MTYAREKLAQVLTAGTRYQLLLGAGVIAVLIGFSESIVRVWLGSKLGSDCRLASQLLISLGVVELIVFSAGTQWPVLLAMGRLRVFLIAALPAGVVYVGTSIVLVGYTSLGLWGVIIPNLVLSFLVRVVIGIQAAKQCSLRVWDYLTTSYFRPLVVFCLLLGFCIFIDLWLKPASYPVLAACAGLAVAFWTLSCWYVGFSATDRHGLLLLLNNARTKIIGAESLPQASVVRKG